MSPLSSLFLLQKNKATRKRLLIANKVVSMALFIMPKPGDDLETI